MTEFTPTITIDAAAEAAYLRLADRPIARTCELTDAVNVDLDEFDMVVGVELLTSTAVIPTDRLRTEFHVPSNSLGYLEVLRGTVAHSASEGTSKHSQDLLDA